MKSLYSLPHRYKNLHTNYEKDRTILIFKLAFLICCERTDIQTETCYI